MRMRSFLALLLGLGLMASALAQPPERPERPERPRVFVGLRGEPAMDGTGVVVRDLAPDSPAAKAGLKPNDVIVQVGDKTIKSFETMTEALAGKKPGDKLSLKIKRDGKEQTIEVTLAAPPMDAQPGQPRPREPRPGEPRTGEGRSTAFMGVQTQDLTPELRARLGIMAEKGAVVADVLDDSPAAKAGIKEGDVITAIDNTAIDGPAILRETVAKGTVGKTVTVKLTRGQNAMEVKVTLGEPPSERSTPRPPRFPGLPDRPGTPDRPGLPGGLPGGESPRIRELERRLQDLERRLQELEKKGSKP